MQDEKWYLPEALRITNPDVLEKAEAFQKQLAQKANSPFAHLSPREQEQVNAARIVDHLSVDLNRIDDELAKQENKELHEGRYAIASRLAEAYATLGRFQLALEVDPRETHRAEHLAILEALNRDTECECAPGKSFIKKELPQGTLISCSGCNTLRVVQTIPKNLADQKAMRAKARTMVEGMTPDEASKTLKAAGHTTDKLI